MIHLLGDFEAAISNTEKVMNEKQSQPSSETR
jgi:hypothetical protein